MKERGLY